MDESTEKRQTIEKRKKLSELLVEAGIVKAEELPRGLEYNQKASDSDLLAVGKAKELINEQGLSIPTALRALTLSKQKRIDFEQALSEIGWRGAGLHLDEQRQVKSAFNSADLENIGVRHSVPGLKAGLKASGLNLKPGASKPLALDTADPNANDPRFQSSSRLTGLQAPNVVPQTEMPRSRNAAADSGYASAPGDIPTAEYGIVDDTVDRLVLPEHLRSASDPLPGAPLSPPPIPGRWSQPGNSPLRAPENSTDGSGESTSAESPGFGMSPPLPGSVQPPPLPGAMPPPLPSSVTPPGAVTPPGVVTPPGTVTPPGMVTPLDTGLAPPPLPGVVPPPLPGVVPPPLPGVMPPPLPGAAPPPLPGAALPPDFLSAVQMADTLFDQRAYEQAEILYAQAIEILERAVNDPARLATLLLKMGRACLQTSEYSRAERHLTRALKIREELLGREDIAVAECLDYLAELFDVQSQYLEAEQYYLSALGIKERVLTPAASEVANSLKKLVAVSKHRGLNPGEQKLSGELLTEAGLIDLPKLEEGLNLAQQKAVPVGRALISLNYLNESDLESVLLAQLLLREGVIPGYLAVRALRIASEQQLEFEQALKEIGLEPGDEATSGAFELLQMAKQLIRAENELAPDHPELASLCVKLGDLYLGHLQCAQAESLFNRALGIEEKQHPQDSMRLIEVLSRLSDLHVRQQQYDQAEQIYVRLLDLWETQDTENIAYSNTLESLATLNYLRGDYKESGRLYQLAINHKERLLGPEHPGVVSALQGRANCYFATQRFADAEKLYRRAFKTHEKVYGNANEVAVSIACTLGDLFFAQNEFAKALEEYAQALDCLGNCSDPDVAVFLSVLEKAAHSLYQSGDLEKADTYYRHYINTREGSGTSNTPDMAEALDRYALVLDGLNRPKEAANARTWAEETRRACGI